MSLGWKLLLLLGFVFGLYLETTHLIHRFVLAPTFDALERDEALDDANRCRSALRNDTVAGAGAFEPGVWGSFLLYGAR